MAAPFPGQAGEQQAYYALVGEHPANNGIAALFANATSDDLKWGQFPWLPLGLACSGRSSSAWPCSGWRSTPRSGACGASCRSWRRATSTSFRTATTVARSAASRATSTPRSNDSRTRRPSARTWPGKDLNAILGPSGGSTFDLPAADSAFSGGGPPPAFAPPPPPSFSAPPPAPSFSAPPMPSFSPPPAPSFAPPQPFSAASLGFGGSGSESAMPASDGSDACRCRARPGRRPGHRHPACRTRGRQTTEQRRRRDARRPLRSRRGRGSALPPYLR